jgi:hypothetical protein
LLGGVRHGERALPLPAEQQDRLAEHDRSIQNLERKLIRFIAEPKVATSADGRPLRPPVNARQNEEAITPVEAKFIRFTILAASSGEPGIDELEVWAGNRNVALASHGTKATASSTLPGHEIHQLKHLNDGQYGNRRSWISNEPGRGWVQLELPQVERLERIVWGRDHEGNFGDRVATQYRIEAGLTTNDWRLVASSEDREPFPGQQPKPAGPEYRFEDSPADEAEQGRRWLAELEAAREQRKELAKPPMIYAGMFREPKPMHRFHRGDAMQPRELVPPGTLAVFNPLTLATNTPEQARRLELANWIASPENPLTARVMVNRLWHHHFGVGLVDTPNDFGLNGSRPTHPELLDWLAAEFVAEGWSIKRLHRLILTSATWRQSSAPRAAPARSRGHSRQPARRQRPARCHAGRAGLFPAPGRARECLSLSPEGRVWSGRVPAHGVCLQGADGTGRHLRRVRLSRWQSGDTPAQHLDHAVAGAQSLQQPLCHRPGRTLCRALAEGSR